MIPRAHIKSPGTHWEAETGGFLEGWMGSQPALVTSQSHSRNTR